LLESLFDPRAQSPMSIVVGLQDPGYCESKSLELISEAKQLAKMLLWDQYREKVSQAIALLALCKVQRAEVQNGPVETEEAARTGVDHS
jgi:hypothetical protein